MSAAETTPTSNGFPGWVRPDGPEAAAAERARPSTGVTHTLALTAEPLTLDLAGVAANTWGYRGERRPVIRVGRGDELAVRIENRLPEATSVHWHGLALRNDADGAPPVAGAEVAPGESAEARFIVPTAGTHWFHSHSGLQLDRGLFGALIVEDPEDTGAVEAEWVLVLDDWLDGLGTTPDGVYEELRAGMSHHDDHDDPGSEHNAAAGHAAPTRDGFTLMGTHSDELGPDTGDVFYPHYLINDRPAADPAQFSGRPGDRVRVRIINAGGDTAFRFAVGGHRLTVTHSDGFPVRHTETDSVLIGMGERVDLLLTLGDGAFPIVAEAEGKAARAFAILRTASGEAPSADAPVPELSTTLPLDRLRAADAVQLVDRAVDRELPFVFTGGMAHYDWGVNGLQFDGATPLAGALGVSAGERVRLLVRNDTDMWHPFHLHGHTGQLSGAGPRKDTVVVRPGQSLSFDFDADNPGLWPAHCHNAYHLAAGMMAVVGYRQA